MNNIFKNRSHYLGFDDRPMVAIGIPLVAILVNTILFGHLIQDNAYSIFGYCYFTAIYYTIIYWFAFRELYFILIKKYPNIEEVRKRQMITVVGFSIAFIIVHTLADYLLKNILKLQTNIAEEPEPLLKLITSMVFSVLVMTIYEGIHLSTQLGIIHLEKEILFKNNIKSQLEALRQQINPHFLFNSLNTLSSLIHEDATRADNFLTKLAKVYRYMLDNESKNAIPIKEELSYLHAYVHLLSERFGNTLIFEEQIDGKLYEKYIIPLSLQITFENCVKHNIATRERPLKIMLEDVEEGTYLCISNNIQKISFREGSTSVGLENLSKRYSYFTGVPVKVDQNKDSFKVYLPILKEFEHEHHKL